MPRMQIHVSDHAILRYIERAHGIDIAYLRRHIEKTVRPAIEAGASGLLTEGVRFCFRGHAVTTVLPGGPRIQKCQKGRP